MELSLTTSIVILVGLILAEIIVVIYAIYDVHQKRKTEIKIASITDATERLKLYANFDFDKIDARINRYIDDAGMEYKIENFEYVEPDQLYLTEEKMNDMIKGMTAKVMIKITPAVFSILQLSYNIRNEKELIEFLYQKIKLYVLNYSFEANAEIEEISQ